ncbi:MAG: M28 family peptidase [Planctomycetota bacterium]|nr:M28 family peptidase [Planctomycetota bacterium]
MKYPSHSKQLLQTSPSFLAAIAAFAVLISWSPPLHAEKITSPPANPKAINSIVPKPSPAYQEALDSITAETLKQHVYFLADDELQGRKPGTQGGRAAGRHIAEEFEKYGLAPGDLTPGDAGEDNSDGDYFQPFSNRYRNVLAILAGSDPRLEAEMVIIAAHYDHLGRRSGRIYNGADDNASGTAGLLELAEAFSMLPTPPRRTILFAAWDAEESGLLGSMHWLRNPSPSDAKVVFMINMDMIGRLRDDKLTIHAHRSGFGLRRLLATLNSDFTLNFVQQIRMRSDHYSFYSNGIPAIMFNTGRHAQLHKPSDDAELINAPGMRRVTRLVFAMAELLANADHVTQFREASRDERPQANEQHYAKSLDSPQKPLKLGIFWRADDAEPGTVVLTRVVPDMPAAHAGLKPGDRIYRLNGMRFKNDAEFAKGVTRGNGPLQMLVEHHGKLRSVEVRPWGEKRGIQSQ